MSLIPLEKIEELEKESTKEGVYLTDDNLVFSSQDSVNQMRRANEEGLESIDYALDDDIKDLINEYEATLIESKMKSNVHECEEYGKYGTLECLRAAIIKSIEDFSMNSDHEFMHLHFIESFDSLLDNFEESVYLIKAKNLGWKNASGIKIESLDCTQDLYSKVLPNTDVTIDVFKEANAIRVKCYHHDSPTGEDYYIHPINQQTLLDLTVNNLDTLLVEAIESHYATVSEEHAVKMLKHLMINNKGELIDELFNNHIGVNQIDNAINLCKFAIENNSEKALESFCEQNPALFLHRNSETRKLVDLCREQSKETLAKIIEKAIPVDEAA